MLLLEHSTFDAESIAVNLGAPEYSYWFVRKAYRPLLERLGRVVAVSNPDGDGAALAAEARERGEPCVLLSFNPPQYMPMATGCPVVPVFAWEFDRIPDESWNANPQEDWRVPLAVAPAGITHSSASAEAVRRTAGADYPIWTIPAPVYRRAVDRRCTVRPLQENYVLPIENGVAIDSWAVDLALFRGGRAFTDGQRAISLLRRAITASPAGSQLRLDGVVYTSVFNPADGRKNWDDLIGAFVWAFRGDIGATLILKVTHADLGEAVLKLLDHMSRQGAFRCRIVIVFGLLSDRAYGALIDATSYCVNASQGEGQCLPLMEFMSAGRPALAPDHTAMADYISPENAFVVMSTMRPGFWPHDHRQALRCLRYEPQFADLVRQFRKSFRVAIDDTARYNRMSAAASEAQRRFCSDEILLPRLREVLGYVTDRGGTARDEVSKGLLVRAGRWWRGVGNDLAIRAKAFGSGVIIDE